MSDTDISITRLMSVAEEEARAADLEIVKIVDSACTDCFNIEQAVNLLSGSNNAEIVSESTLEFSSNEAKALINRYGIEKIPTVVVTGETNKSNIRSLWSQFGDVKENGAVIFTQLTPVYIDAETSEAVGRVSLTHIKDSSCDECTDLTNFIQQLKDARVQITTETILDYTSDEAQELIQRYNITTIPALVFSEDMNAYENIKQSWNQFGTVEQDGSYIMREAAPPYRDTATDKIKGLVSLIMLNDSSCDDCYDVTAHKNVLPGYGVYVANESTYDVASEDGKALLSDYNITKVPTILLSPEADVYSALKQIWTQVGTTEDDGWLVFKSVEQMGSYMDLTTGSIVTP